MTTSTKLPTNYAVEPGGVSSWYEASKVVADDGQYARVGLAREVFSPAYSQALKVWGYDFDALQAGFSISDVSVEFDYSASTQVVSYQARLGIDYWNGTAWVPTDGKVFEGNTFGTLTFSLGALSAAVLASWKTQGAIRFALQQTTNTGYTFQLDAVRVTVTYAAPSAPTVTEIAPAAGSSGGGTLVTITGTNFQTSGDEPQDLVSAVEIGGVACTEVTVVSATSLTCRVGAHAAGAVDVVVTNAGGSGTLSNGFTYLSVADNVVKVVKGGAVSGSNAAAADLWPAEPTEAVYGGPAELWDSLTIADINAENFGFVVSATVGTGAVARVDYAAARFYYGVPGLSDPASYLAVLRVDADRQTARPDLYQLPRNGFSVSNDPQIDRRLTAGGEFRFSRQFGPGRLVEKVLHSRELWLEESVAGNTPGLQVWARMDEGPEFQLVDAGGAPATLRGTGPREVFWPAGGDVGRCHYWQLIYRVPPVGAGQVAAAYTFRDGITHLLARPKVSWMWETTLVLGSGEFEDRTSQRLSPAKQLAVLQRLREPGAPAVPYQDPFGGRGFLHVVGLNFREVVNKEGPAGNVYVANVKLRMARYD